MTLLPNIEPDVWAARPLLKDIREAAHARAAGADPVLWSVLVSVAAHIPARVSIDTGIGSHVRPTLFAALAGPSGTGKSLAWGVGRALVPGPEPLPLSTGEGMIEAFYGKVPIERPQADGKPPKLVWERRRIRSNALFWLDEGETLFKQAERAASVVGPTLRGFWSGGTVGQHNAGEELRRSLDAGTYTGGLVLGLQPDVTGRLLADTSTGTAQRFLWSAVTDIHQPDGDLSARALRPLDWQAPALPGTPSKLDQWRDQPGQVWTDPPDPTPVTMTLDAEIAEGVRRRQVAIRRGEVTPEPHDAQRSAMHVKVAAVLAWTDARLGIGAEDWQLAEALLAASDGVRDALIEHAEMVVAAERAERGVARAQVSRAESAAAGRRRRCQDRVIDVLTKSEHVSHSELRKLVSRVQRPYVPEVLAELIAKGAITEQRVRDGGRAYALDLTAAEDDTEGAE